MKRELLIHLLTTEELYISLSGVVEGVNLQDGDWGVVNWVKQFRSEHSRLPSVDELRIRFSFMPEKTALDESFVREEILRYVREDKLRRWILTVAEGIDKGKVNYQQTFEELKGLRDQLEIRSREGSQVGGRYREIVEVVSTPEMQERIGSGIRGLDKVLGGGFGRGELCVLIAPPGVGKTMFLLNCMYGVLVNRKNAVYLTCEMSEEAILERLYRRIAEVSRSDIRTGKEKVIKSLDRFFKFLKSSGFVVYKRTGRWGVEDLSLYIDRLRGEGIKVDVVLIDYLDKLRMGRGELRVALRDLTEDLRYLSIEKGVVVITATQANRASLTSMVVTEEHVGESFGKIEVADVVLSLSRNNKEEEKQHGRLTVLKNRDRGGRGVIVPVRCIFDRSLLSDL